MLLVIMSYREHMEINCVTVLSIKIRIILKYTKQIDFKGREDRNRSKKKISSYFSKIFHLNCAIGLV